MRGETIPAISATQSSKISIHSPHARGDEKTDETKPGVTISIHSPHARGDGLRAWLFSGSCHFNPLPSCEGRLIDDLIAEHERRFQSTPLMRGETDRRRWTTTSSWHFNPLPSCEGRHRLRPTWSGQDDFNPLPSCEGRPVRARDRRGSGNNFNPLPSCEGRRRAP